MPVDVRHRARSGWQSTVWCSDHDPMNRMKGMHGVCLHPGRRRRAEGAAVQPHALCADVSLVGECRGSGFTSSTSRFSRRMCGMLPTTRSGQLASFRCVRAVITGWTTGSAASGCSGGRAAGAVCSAGGRTRRTILRWYANIPVPTSYMVWARRAISSAATITGAGRICPRGEPSHRAGQEAVDVGQPRVRLRVGPQSDRSTNGYRPTSS